MEIGGNAAEIPVEKKWSLVVVLAGCGVESSPRLASAHFGINWQHEWQRLRRLVLALDALTILDELNDSGRKLSSMTACLP